MMFVRRRKLPTSPNPGVIYTRVLVGSSRDSGVDIYSDFEIRNTYPHVYLRL